MEINTQKLEDNKIVKIKFPSKTKARKFTRTLVNKYNYQHVSGTVERAIIVYSNIFMACAYEDYYEDYTEYIIQKPPKLQPKGQVIKGLPYTDFTMHYITKDINNSDLALRFYIDFGSRPDYIGKWFVKCKRTKNYLSITEAEAKMISENMCTDSFTRVIGFRERCGFRRLVVNAEGVVRGTLNNNPQPGVVLNRKPVTIGEQNGN